MDNVCLKSTGKYLNNNTSLRDKNKERKRFYEDKVFSFFKLWNLRFGS